MSLPVNYSAEAVSNTLSLRLATARHMMQLGSVNNSTDVAALVSIVLARPSPTAAADPTHSARPSPKVSAPFASPQALSYRHGLEITTSPDQIVAHCQILPQRSSCLLEMMQHYPTRWQ